MFKEYLWLNFISFVFTSLTQGTLYMGHRQRQRLWYALTNGFFLLNAVCLYSCYPDLLNLHKPYDYPCTYCIQVGNMYMALLLFNHTWKCLDIEVKYKKADVIYTIASVVTLHLLLTRLFLPPLFFFIFCQSLVGFMKGCSVFRNARVYIHTVYPLLLTRHTYHILPLPVLGSLVVFSYISWKTS